MKRYRAKPGKLIKLSDYDPGHTATFDGGKRAGRIEQMRLTERIEQLQEALYAEGKHKLLIVLQGMDCSGKDGTIRRVFEGVNPQGVTVVSFKVPTEEELSHDYLWRVHRRTPRSGRITIFNRSHYEDVLVVRVKKLVPRGTWKRRFEHICAWERLLVDEGTTILKFFLNISKEEQKERLQARLDEPDKNWKFSRGDLADRALWEDYQEAYEDVLRRTSTDWAPWYMIPADRKWYRDLVISRIMVNALESLEIETPPPSEDLSDVVIE
ncbi:MAG: polyphosphate kinase 2 family protein [Acidimicrobiia bacterium]|nr:polyphosphate kinase 2 family protein [Acidimicrobiia bacterium]